MSATAREPEPFGSLYYTDCLPGQGLAGTAGFQFQARSTGVDPAAERTVARGGLYEVPTRWLREQRRLEDYPRSLAHLAEDGVVTAAGRYLGKEAKGYREGNQFTHAVVTRDPASYGLLRPAQLWAAPWWAEEPAPTTTCPPVAALPESGPWHTEAVRDHVRRSPRGRERLLALTSALAALDGPDRRRVLIVSPDPGEAAAWVAAGTLLLDRSRALRISFKIFCTDPDRTPHDVLAVHPDWAAPHDRSGDYVVLDLRGDDAPAFPVSPESAFWVPRFLEEDALDVVDAVELAGELAREAGTGAAGSVERTAAALALGVDQPHGPEVREVAAWLAGVRPAVVDLLGAPLVGALAESTDHPTLTALDTATAARRGAPGADDLGWPDLAVDVRRRLFDHEVGAARTGRGVEVPARLAPVAGATRTVEDTATVEAVGQTDPAAAMALADRYALVPTDSMVLGFVRWWADHPDADLPAEIWECSERLCHALSRELEERLADPRRSASTSTDIRESWWRAPWDLWQRMPLLPGTGPRFGLHRVDVEVIRAAFAHGGAPRRVVLARAADVVQVPVGKQWLGAWDTVFPRDGGAVSPGDVRRFVTAVPASALSADLAKHAYQQLRRAPHFDADAREAVTALEDAGWSAEKVGITDYPPTDPLVSEVVMRLDGGARPGDVSQLAERLSKASHATDADRNRLVRALVAAPPLVAGPILAGKRTKLCKRTWAEVGRRATGEGGRAPDPRALALVVVCVLVEAGVPKKAEKVEKALSTVLGPWRGPLRGVGEQGRDEAFRRLRSQSGESPYASDVARLWALWLQSEHLPGPAGPASGRPRPERRDGADQARGWLSGFRKGR